MYKNFVLLKYNFYFPLNFYGYTQFEIYAYSTENIRAKWIMDRKLELLREYSPILTSVNGTIKIRKAQPTEWNVNFCQLVS